jgi:hypothetical protein
VAADVEPPAFPLHGAADAAHHVVGLQDGDGPASLGELVRGGQAGGAGADDDDAGKGAEGLGQGCLLLRGPGEAGQRMRRGADGAGTELIGRAD